MNALHGSPVTKGGGWPPACVEATSHVDETASLAPTVVDEQAHVFSFAGDDEPNESQEPQPSRIAPASDPGGCECGFCSSTVEISGAIPLPLVVQFRHRGRRVNATLMHADDMPSATRGGSRPEKQIVVTRGGTRFEHLSSAACAIFRLKNSNGFRLCFVNTTAGPRPLSKLCRTFVQQHDSAAPPPGVCSRV